MTNIETIVVSMGGSAFLYFILIWITKSWITERLKKSIEFEYSQKLLTLKAQLTAEYGIAKEQLRVSTSTLTSINLASFNQRLKAIKIFWEALIKIKYSNLTSIFTVIDLFQPKDYTSLVKNVELEFLFSYITTDNLLKAATDFTDNTAKYKPFIGSFLHSLFDIYVTLIFRICHILDEGKKKGEIAEWYKDTVVEQLLPYVLYEKEIDELNNRVIEKIKFMQMTVEQRIISEIGKVLSGESDSALSFEQTKKLVGLLNFKSELK